VSDSPITTESVACEDLEAAPEAAPGCRIDQQPEPMPRRSFLVWLASALLAISGLSAGAVVVEGLIPPDRSIDGKTKAGRMVVGRVADLQLRKPASVDYGDDVLFLVKTSATQVVVLSQTCPHVGCKVKFNGASQQFDCPCHASHFSIDGKRLGGPSPRDMFSADFQVVDGEIVVSGIQA
jgi:Rieske Fe-S protein